MPLSQNLSALHTQMARRGHLLQTAEQLLPHPAPSSQSEISPNFSAAPEETGPSGAAAAVFSPTSNPLPPFPENPLHLQSGLHEWFYELDLTPDSPAPPPAAHRTSNAAPLRHFVPLMLLAALAQKITALRPGYIVWIGKNVWPTEALLRATTFIHDSALTRGSALPPFRQTALLDPLTTADRIWAIEQALLCPAVAVVIADGRGLNIAATRRLQLAAEHPALSPMPSPTSSPTPSPATLGPLALLARPYQEHAELSLACARWRVTPAPVAPAQVMGLHWLRKGGLNTLRNEKNRTVLAAWTVECCRGKGRPRETASAAAEPSCWHVQWVCENGDATGHLYLSADVGNRSALAPPPNRLIA